MTFHAHSSTVGPSDPSWWFADALAAEGGSSAPRSLKGRIEVDVVIVGGGFTGLWTALALWVRQPSLRVALIEKSLCGSGASGKNGGKVHGYWGALAGMEANIGADRALAVARAGTRAQDGIRNFATSEGRDVWWRESGNLRISIAPAQDARIASYVSTAQRLGVPDTALALSPDEIASRCRSPVFRGGVFLPEGATVHPGRLARELRSAAIAAGVDLYENTPMSALDTGTPNRVRTAEGEIVAREVVLATNVELARERELAPHLSVFSSYAVMTNPAPERLAAMGWTHDEGLADMRMFVHYFRKTRDGRVLMGSGSGPIAFGGNTADPRLTQDKAAAGRAVRGLRRLLPTLSDVPVAKSWGGAIDVSSDRLPVVRTRPGTRIHFACGFSGHGVNPTYMAGQCLASLVLGVTDEWSSLPICTRELPRLPPEPFRTIGGRVVRWGIIGCEEAEEEGKRGTRQMRAAAAIPKLFGLRIGTR